MSADRMQSMQKYKCIPSNQRKVIMPPCKRLLKCAFLFAGERVFVFVYESPL